MRWKQSFVAALAAAAVLAASGVAWSAGDPVDRSFGDEGFALAGRRGQFRDYVDVATDASGRYVATAPGLGFDGRPRVLVSRFDHAGRLDPSFGGSGDVVLAIPGFSSVRRVATTADGGVVIAGDDAAAQPSSFGTTIVKLTSSGGLDTAFDDDGVVRVAPHDDRSAELTIGLAVDTSILVGTATFPTDGSQVAVAELRRFDMAGTPVKTFGNGGVETIDVGYPQDMRAVDGGVLILGDTVVSTTVARTDRAGVLDASFGVGGVTQLPTQPLAYNQRMSEEAPDGSVLVADVTLSGEMQLMRLDARDGSIDTGFGDAGVRSITPAPGEIVDSGAVVGDDGGAPLVVFSAHDETTYVRSFVRRLLRDGRRDDAFGDHGISAFGGGVVSAFNPALGAGLVEDTRAIVAGGSLDTTTLSATAALGALSFDRTHAEPPDAVVDRLAGTDAIATSIAASQDLFGNAGAGSASKIAASVAVLASSTSFPDALVGGPLASARTAPAPPQPP